ncbi:MAG: argininosuccinate lyase [Papillibacter sp.]|nr:argininosuccinate lyase [Papillibacter sp.]
MPKLWEGRTSKETDAAADDFNSSIRIDSRMYRQDIKGSMAHAFMLGAKGIISQEDAGLIISGLEGILADIESGSLQIDMSAEDIHMFVEAELTDRIGEAGKRLHTSRSRNDQVALDTRLYLRDETQAVIELLKQNMETLISRAEEFKTAIMPGYTHLQRAQPVTFAHHLLVYAMMFSRDISRLSDAAGRMNVSPLGACALAGTTYNIDRRLTAARLGLDDICLNSLDAVSDRDFCIELASALSLVMTHLSRFAEELILWSSWEFKFIELDDSYTTGSSIMPQKKNPDMAELIRGKTGRVYGNLVTLLTVMKGLPLAYNKDMQEDKEAIFDSFDSVKACLQILEPMLKTMRVKTDNMRKAAAEGFINATDLADYLVKKGLPFRSSYKIVGQIVALCIEKGLTLETLPLSKYKEYSDLFDEDLYNEIKLENCVSKRIAEGGPAEESVNKQIEYLKSIL